jgi:hypothetical protein
LVVDLLVEHIYGPCAHADWIRLWNPTLQARFIPAQKTTAPRLPNEQEYL